MNPLHDALIAPLARRLQELLRDGQGEVWSGARLHRLAMAQAAALSRAGLRPGDRLAVQVGKSPQALALYLAALASGLVYLPLNPDYTDAEVGYFVENARAAALVGTPARTEGLGALARRLGARFETLDGAEGSLPVAAEAAPAGFAPVPRQPEDLAAILYTSGTTGRSKGAMLTQDNLLSNARALVEAWRITAEDVLLHALPIFHTHGLFVACNTVLLAGARMIFLPKFDLEAVLDALPRATLLMGVPTYYTRLLADPRLTPELVAGMRLFVSGSAPLLAATHAEFEARTGQRILERYGLTETGMNTSNPCVGERRAGTVGLPLPGVELRLTDPESGLEVAEGPGMIEMRGPNVFAGYWEMPEKTAAEKRPDGFFITGDIGSRDGQGYLTIVGRARDLVISGGYNIYPSEVEQVLDACAGVLESAVIGVPHPDLGEAAVAVIVPRPGAAPEPEAIRAEAASRLARYKQPRHLELVAELPRNAMGKVQKAELRRRFAGLFD